MSEPLPSAPADAGQTLPTHHGAPVQPTDETRVPLGAATMAPPPPTEVRHVAGYVVEKELGAAAWASCTWPATASSAAASP